MIRKRESWNMKHGIGKAGLRGYATDCRAEVTAKKRRGVQIKDALQTTLGKTGVHPSPWPENVPHTFPRDGRNSSILLNSNIVFFFRSKDNRIRREVFLENIFFRKVFQFKVLWSFISLIGERMQFNYRQAVVGVKANLSSTF